MQELGKRLMISGILTLATEIDLFGIKNALSEMGLITLAAICLLIAGGMMSAKKEGTGE